MSSKAEKKEARAQLRIQRAKEKARKQFIASKPQVRARHILIKHNKSRTPLSRRTLMPITITKAEAHVELEKILTRLDEVPLEDVEDLFKVIATQRSDCGTYSKGGDLGNFGITQMEKPFEDEVYDVLDIGDLSGIVDTSAGSHLILRIQLLEE